MRPLHAILLAGAALLALPASPLFAHASGSNQDTVMTDGGKIITGTFGSCVRTKWSKGSDACAPEAEPEPEPAPPAPKPVAKPQPSLEQRTVYFDFNKSDLTPTAVQKLDTLAGWVKSSKHIRRATIVGYADAIGSNDYNQALSNTRADVVRSYLLGAGISIPTSVSVVKGMGEEGSVTNCAEVKNRNKQIACLAADRRVEVQFETLR